MFRFLVDNLDQYISLSPYGNQAGVIGALHLGRLAADNSINDTVKQAEKEIIELHAFFEKWFAGEFDDRDAVFDHKFLSRFHPDFVYIPPSGVVISIETLRNAFGTNPNFKIKIEHIKLSAISESHNQVLTGTYEEMQKGAKNSPERNGRISSVVFLRNNTAPNGTSASFSPFST